ncbi:MAG: hypothetical protein QXJ02_06445, partial [Candidatus Bathyarchaeia archaeon]
MAKQQIAETLSKLSSKNEVKYSVYLTAIVVFFILILFPPILGIIIKWNALSAVLQKPQITERALAAILNSFTVALLVSVMNVAAAIPLAWLIARG